jgi:hypothetical protein
MVYVHDGRSTSPQRTQGYVQSLMSLYRGYSQHRHLHVSNAALTRRTSPSRTHKQQSQRGTFGLISTQHNLYCQLSDHRTLGVLVDPAGPPWYVLAPRS